MLAWDFAAKPDQAYASQFFSDGDKPKPTAKTVIAIDHVPNGKYSLEIFRTGYHVNDPLNAYREMGSPYNINRQQEKTLKELSQNKPVTEKQVTISNGKFDYAIDMQSKDVYLIRLTKR